MTVRRDPAGRGTRGGSWLLDTVEDVRDYVARYPEAYGGLRVSGDLVIVSFTADLDEHLSRLQAEVEHPELVRVERATYPIAKLEADIKAICQRLQNDPRRPLLGSRPGHIRLRAPFSAVALELNRMYGSALEIMVGHKPFPPDQIVEQEPVPVPAPTIAVPGLELTVLVAADHIAQGEDFQGTVIFSNRGSLHVSGTTGVLTGGVRSENDDHMAGHFAGATTLIAHQIDLAPGSTTELPLIVGTASCLPDSSYMVPPGRYEVISAFPFNQAGPTPSPPPLLVARGTWITVEPRSSEP